MTGIEIGIAAGIVALAIGLVFLAKYLKNRGLVDSDDLDFASSILGLSVEIIDLLDLKYEKDIKRIANIVINSVNLASEVMKTEYADYDDVYKALVEKAEAFAYESCEDAGIELDDNKKVIISQLIEIALKNNV